MAELGRGWQEPLGGDDKSLLRSLVILPHGKSFSGASGASVSLPRCAWGDELSSLARTPQSYQEENPVVCHFLGINGFARGEGRCWCWNQS